MTTYWCNHMLSPGTLETPAEYCENEAVEGYDHCLWHLGNHDE